MNKNIIKVNGVEINLDAVNSKESSDIEKTSIDSDDDEYDDLFTYQETTTKADLLKLAGVTILAGLAAVIYIKDL